MLDKEAANIERQTMMVKQGNRAKTPTSLRPSKALAINHDRISKLSQRNKSVASDKSVKTITPFFNKCDDKVALLFVDVGLP